MKLSENFETEGTLRLVNGLGQVMLEQQFSGEGKTYTIPLNAIPKGMYVIQVQSANYRASHRVRVQ